METLTWSGSGNSHDPALAALFASSLGSVKRQKVGTNSKSSSRLLAIKEQGKTLIEAEEFSQNAISSPSDDEPIGSDFLQKTSRKRKRDRNDGLEGLYMQQIAKEEAQDERARGSDTQGQLRSKARHIETGDRSADSSAGSSNDTEHTHGLQDHPGEPPRTPGQQDLEKATRTLFLGNVSTAAIKSKSAKKELLEHIAKFMPTPKKDHVPGKVESIRFRSTPFSSNAVPKRAAFAKKELMDSTTRSTNAYVIFSTASAMQQVAKRLNGTIVLERHLRADMVAHPAPVDNRRCVFVGNLGFVDDESASKAEGGDGGERRPRKTRAPSDSEEGLWRQFSKAGKVESVRVVRDPTTRVGKGFAYVQFEDANAVEKALFFDQKKFPPMLPRVLRVTRAKNMKRKTRRDEHGKSVDKQAQRGPTRFPNKRQPDQNARSLSGRAGKLLGRAGSARLKRTGKPDDRPKSKAHVRSQDSSATIFEGVRASSGQDKPLKSGGSGKKHGKPRNRSSKRGADFKASGGKKSK